MESRIEVMVQCKPDNNLLELIWPARDDPSWMGWPSLSTTPPLATGGRRLWGGGVNSLPLRRSLQALSAEGFLPTAFLAAEAINSSLGEFGWQILSITYIAFYEFK